MNESCNTVKAVEPSAGEAFPLGATLSSDGCNFAVYAPDAKAVILCFFNKDTEEATVEYMLPEKTGDVWHGFFNGIKARSVLWISR